MKIAGRQHNLHQAYHEDKDNFFSVCVGGGGGDGGQFIRIKGL